MTKLIVTYGRVARARGRWLVVYGTVFLIFMVIWQKYIQAPIQVSAFKPQLQIEQVESLSSMLSDLGQSTSSQSIPDQNIALPCSGRSLRVLTARVMDKLEISSQQATILLKKMSQPSQNLEWSSCTNFFRTVIRSMQFSMAESLSGTIEQTFTEGINWTMRIPCVYSGNIANFELELGNPLHCSTANWSPRDALIYAPNSSYKRTIRDTSRALGTAAASGNWGELGEYQFTLDPEIHKKLDSWIFCKKQNTCDRWPVLLDYKLISIVIADANSAEILATFCYGAACDRAKTLAPGSLPAAMVEAPPASTTKLLFAMALGAEAKPDELRITQELKTSGQLGPAVSKRNEWWEKQVICDGHATKCRVAEVTLKIAESWGWNANCDSANNSCGLQSLVSAGGQKTIPAFIGRLPITNSTGQKYIDWSTYNKLRARKTIVKKGPEGEQYLATSQAVQAVLGSGDSRISAMGLAVLSSQIWSTSKGQPGPRPTIVRPNEAIMSEAPNGLLQRSANIVLSGMRKVVQPQERGWIGVGTASGAVSKSMSKDCSGDCGLWAKTGTVSFQDKANAGTTLMTAIVDTERWSNWFNRPLKPSLKRRVLSIGVISQAVNTKATAPHASHVGMHVIKEFLTGDSNE